MELSAKVNDHASQPPKPLPAVRQKAPLLVFLIGAGITALALSADLIGLAGWFGGSFLKTPWLWAGLGILAIGAAMDLIFGRRGLIEWLKPIALDGPGLLKFLSLAIQLYLLTVVMRMCFLEHAAFYEKVMTLVFYGFIIHYFLPQRFRLAFFILLSFTAILAVFGLADGAWLLGISLVLIGVCHAPIAFWLRVMILVAAAGAMTAARFGYFSVPWSKALWPILASMFMFRLIIYLYDLKHNKAPISFTRTLSYFFLLPNVAFPLFPVVDYNTFCRTYYNDNQYRIYQKGLKWMFWGVVHLLIYRYINYYWIISPEKVQNTATLVQYMASNYLLIIRLSGQFHLIVGILHLFGFNLPRIMDLYLLSTGFTDYWRRVNVYWKEFIQKVFYYPAYFKMRQVGNTTKLMLATALGFLVTWFLHSYQWFWIRGAFAFSVPDTLFWLSLALLVLANSLYEAKHGRKRALVKRAATLGEIASKTLRAAGVFVVMAILWSLWVSPTLADWVALISGATVTLPGVFAALAAIIAVLGAATVLYEKWPALKAEASEKEISFFRFAAPMAGAIVLLYFLVQPEFHFRLGLGASHLIADLKTNRLNARDEALLQRGYYEELNNVNTFNSQLWELYAQRPDDWRSLTQTEAVRRTNDFLRYELVPSLDGSIKDAPFKTNRWGMRDDDYEQTPAAKTCRIAMLGASVELGSGLMHEEIFEYLLEKRLNQAHAREKYDRYEILNFSVGGYHLLQQLIILERKVLDFKPNAIFYVAHGSEEGRLFFKSPLTPARLNPAQIPFEDLREILRRAGVTKAMNAEKMAERLAPVSDEILLWAYGRIVEQCRQRDILPVWVCLPTWPGVDDSARVARLVPIAEQAGFIALNLFDAYDGAKGAYLQLAPWDKHPNARGHRLIAERLYEALRKNEDKIHLGLSAAATDISASGSE